MTDNSLMSTTAVENYPYCKPTTGGHEANCPLSAPTGRWLKKFQDMPEAPMIYMENGKPPVMLGWRCPNCGQGNSPFIQQCSCGSKKVL